MERSLSVHRKCLKRSEVKKKPIKVVYISNPMRVTTSAATFRALVQKLTGRDPDADAVNSSFATESADVESSVTSAAASEYSSGSTQYSDPSACCSVDPCNSLVAPAEVFDEGFGALMPENFCGFMSSTLCYEPPLVGPWNSNIEV